MSDDKHTVLKQTGDCSCNACSTGCQFGSGFFAPEELLETANHLELSLQEFKQKFLEPQIIFQTELFRPKFNKPFGKCTFFEENKCKIHEVKPLQCKLAMNCKPEASELQQWFYHNYALQEKNQLSVEEYNNFLEHQTEQKNE